MNSSKGLLDEAKNCLEPILWLASFAAQSITYFLKMTTAEESPLISSIVSAAGLILFGILLFRLFKKQKPKWLLSVLIAVAVISLIFWCILFVPSIVSHQEAPMQGGPPLHTSNAPQFFSDMPIKIGADYRLSSTDEGDYRKPRNILALVNISNVDWIYGFAFALVNKNQKYPLAFYSGPQNVFTGTDCVLQFRLAARPEAGTVHLDKLRVLVNSFRPLPKYSPAIPAPILTSQNYYVRLEKPNKVRSRFDATLYIDGNAKKKTLDPSLILDINQDHPENIILHIDSKTPGIYDFSVVALLSNNRTKQAISVVDHAVWFFDVREMHRR